MKKQILLILFLLTIVFLGLSEKFLLISFIVAIHELAHITIAFFFGVKPKKIVFSPIGQIVNLKGMELLSFDKKLLILLSGPLFNIFLWFLFLKFFPDKYVEFRNYNLILGVFNLLPAIPLDGGKLLQNILYTKMGVLVANKIVIKISKIISILLIIIGIIQVVLFPFNISLICIGIYSIKILDNEKIKMASDFYKTLLLKNKKTLKSTLKINNIAAKKETSIKKILSKLRFDDYLIVNIINNDNIIYTLSENELVNYIINHGFNGSLQEIIITYKNNYYSKYSNYN